MSDLPKDSIKGISTMGIMAGELLKSFEANGFSRAEAVDIVKQWFIETMTRSKPASDSLVDYMKNLKTSEVKKQ